MSLQKVPIFRSPKLLDNARHYEVCAWCRVPRSTGSIIAAHYQGIWANQFGKGMGQKPSDFATAYICNICHDIFDDRVKSPKLTEEDKAILFFAAHVRTLEQLHNDGRLVIL